MLDKLEHKKEFLRGAAVMAVTMQEARTCSEGTGLRGQRVTRIAELLGKALRLTPAQLWTLRYGSALHDIGKETIPDVILNKPGALTPEERDVVQTHAEAGFMMLLAVGFPGPVALVAAQHHEWWNGAGYPNKLGRLSICIQARILTVADAYDAMTTDRIYKPRRSHQEAVEELKQFQGKQFDPEVVKVFIKLDERDLSFENDGAIWN